MDDVILKRIEIIENGGVIENKFELKYNTIREEYGINSSFIRDYCTNT